MKALYTPLAFLVIPVILSAEILDVPGDFQSIQSAIDNADDRDTVLVQPGTYYERIRFNERAVVVGSLFILNRDEGYIERTIIDANGDGRPVTFEIDEPRRPVLSGFTLTGGNTENGGAIFCSNFNPTLDNLLITDNHARVDGGGIFCRRQSSPRITNVRIVHNTAEGQGGGFYCRDTSGPYILNSTIERNQAGSGGGIFCNTSSSLIMTDVSINGNSSVSFGGGMACAANSNVRMTRVLVVDNSAEDLAGGGMYMSTSEVDLVNVTLSRNRTDGEGGGIFVIGESTLEITNSILWGNSNYQVYSHGSPNPAVPIVISYSDIEGGQNGIFIQGNAELDWLDGNINSDPMFVAVEVADFHLSSNSPCIDAGDPDSRNDPDGTRADMGALYYDASGLSPENPSESPGRFQLLDLYPNPSNGNVIFRFDTGYSAPVKLYLFDQRGRLVVKQTTVLSPGSYTLPVNCVNLVSGVYYVRVDCGKYRFDQKLVLIR